MEWFEAKCEHIWILGYRISEVKKVEKLPKEVEEFMESDESEEAVDLWGIKDFKGGEDEFYKKLETVSNDELVGFDNFYAVKDKVWFVPKDRNGLDYEGLIFVGV